MAEPLEDSIGDYVEVAISALNEVRAVVDEKEAALRRHDFYEAYRLAGVLTLMVTKSEEIEAEMSEVMYGRENRLAERGEDGGEG